MPDNNIYGVDFIARCMAGEALDKAGQKSWTLVAGNNISILSDEEEKTETISAEIEVDDALSPTSTNPVENRVIYDALQNVEIDVDDTLSTTSENPVQNKVITAALKTKPTSVLPDGTVVSDQKIMALTRAQYNAIQNKDPNTYYMITDDPVPSPINVRTAYVDMIDSYTKTKVNDNKYNVVFNAPAGFELLEARISYSITFTCGAWVDATLSFTDTLSIPSSVGSTPREGRKIYTQKLVDHYSSDATPVHYNQMVDEVTGANFIYYDAQTGKITLEIGNLTCPYVEYTTGAVDNTTLVISDLTITSLGYVAYGPNNVVISDAFVAGQGITIDGTTIGLTDAPAADVIARVSNGDLTIQIEDADGVPMGAGATVTLPTELPASTSLDNGKVLTVDSNGDPAWSAGQSFTQVQSDWSQSNSSAVDYIKNKPDLSVYETTVHASSTYATQTAISDMATQTWVGQQGFLTSADEVPTVGSSDDGKVLTATYSGGTGSYAWETASGGLPASTSYNEDDVLTVDSNGDPIWGTLTWANARGLMDEPDPSTDDGKVLTYDTNSGVAVWATPSSNCPVVYGPIYEVIENNVAHGYNSILDSQSILTIPALTVPTGKTPILRFKTTVRNVRGINLKFNTDTTKYYYPGPAGYSPQNADNETHSLIIDLDISNYISGTDVLKLGATYVDGISSPNSVYFDYAIEIIYVDTVTHTWTYSQSGD